MKLPWWIGWFALLGLVFAGCATPGCEAGPSGTWHQDGLFAAARLAYGGPLPPGYSWEMELPPPGMETFPQLPFDDEVTDAWYQDAYALASVSYETTTGDILTLGPVQGDAAHASNASVILLINYWSGGVHEEEVVLFLGQATGLNEREASLVADEWLANTTDPAPDWTGDLPLRLGPLFRSLHPSYQRGFDPTVDAPWNFGFVYGKVQGYAEVDGLKVTFSANSLDQAWLSFYDVPPQRYTVQDYTIAVLQVMENASLPPPSFEHLQYTPTVRLACD